MLRYTELPVAVETPRCRSCPSRELTRPLGRDAFAAALASAVTAAGGCIALTGGDVFADPAWREIVSSALTAGARNLRVDAGAALAETSVAEEALRIGVRHVRVRPDADDAHLLAVSAFLEAAARVGVEAFVSASVDVCRHKLHALPSLITALARAGVAEAELVVDPSLPAAPTAPWLAAAADTGTVNRLWVRISGIPVEALSAYAIHFTEPFTVGASS